MTISKRKIKQQSAHQITPTCINHQGIITNKIYRFRVQQRPKKFASLKRLLILSKSTKRKFFSGVILPKQVDPKPKQGLIISIFIEKINNDDHENCTNTWIYLKIRMHKQPNDLEFMGSIYKQTSKTTNIDILSSDPS